MTMTESFQEEKSEQVTRSKFVILWPENTQSEYRVLIRGQMADLWSSRAIVHALDPSTLEEKIQEKIRIFFFASENKTGRFTALIWSLFTPFNTENFCLSTQTSSSAVGKDTSP